MLWPAIHVHDMFNQYFIHQKKRRGLADRCLGSYVNAAPYMICDRLHVYPHYAWRDFKIHLTKIITITRRRIMRKGQVRIFQVKVVMAWYRFTGARHKMKYMLCSLLYISF